jgi:hypothetical protein
MRDYLNAEIERRKATIAKIDAERQALTERREEIGIELRVYVDILAQLNRIGAQERPGPQTAPNEPSASVTSPAETPEVPRTKISGHWRVVLRVAVERFPASVSYPDVGTIQRSAGHDPSPYPNIRSHFQKLVAEGLYERADRGRVRATEKAAQFLGIPLGKSITGESETPNSNELSGAPKGNGALPLNL